MSLRYEGLCCERNHCSRCLGGRVFDQVLMVKPDWDIIVISEVLFVVYNRCSCYVNSSNACIDLDPAITELLLKSNGCVFAHGDGNKLL